MNLLRISSLLGLLVICQGVDFRRNLVSVVFNPYIAFQDLCSPMGYNYNEERLTEMVSTISTRFSKILIQNGGPNQAFHLHRIPMTIAKFNKFHRIPGEEVLELAISYKLGEPGRELENLNFLLKLGKKANSVFSGSVKSLTLDCSEVDSIEFLLTRKELLEALQRATDQEKFPYQVGIILPFSECSKIHEVLKIEDYFELVMFAIKEFPFTDKMNLPTSSDTLIERMTMEMKQCKNNLANLNSQSELIISFITSVDALKIHNVQDVGEFWKEMNNFAEWTNTPVVLFEAFDNFLKPNPQNTLGWWRVKSEGNIGTELVFEEKQNANPIFPGLAKTVDMFSYFHGLRSTYLSNLLPGFENPYNMFNSFPRFTFNPHHVMVSFDSRFLPEEKTIHEESNLISGMIDLISTTFTKVILHPSSPSRYKNRKSGAFLALEIAQWNHLNASSKQPPIEVVMQYVLQQAGNETDPNSFEITKKVANEANHIYPGTVSSIVLRFEDNDTKLDNILNQLMIIKEATMDGKFPYKIGVAVPLMFCIEQEDQLSEIMKQVVLLSDEIILVHKPSVRMMEFGVDFFLSVSTKYYDECIKNIEAFRSKASIHLELSWSGRNDMEIINFANLVNLWIKANAWARDNNARVILSESFNSYVEVTPSPSPNRPNNGWWVFDKQSGKFFNKASVLQSYYMRHDSYKKQEDCRKCDKQCNCSVEKFVWIILFLCVIRMIWC